MRIKIETEENNYIHFDGTLGDQTLCGLEQDGDHEIGIMPGVKTTLPVDCPDCLQIVRYCKKIRLKSTEENR